MKKISLSVAAFLLLAGNAFADEIGFSCQGKSGYGDGDKTVWKYRFEVDQTSSKGTLKGNTLDGTPYVNDIEVVFTPERMQIKMLGARKLDGYIDRRNLAFSYGGAVGKCKMVKVEKPKTVF